MSARITAARITTGTSTYYRYLCVLLAVIFFVSLVANAEGQYADTSINDEDDDDEPSLNVTELDCRFRRLTLQYARQLQPWRNNESESTGSSVFQLVRDALQLNTGSVSSSCGESDDDNDEDDATVETSHLPDEPKHASPPPSQANTQRMCATKYCICVSTTEYKSASSPHHSVPRETTLEFECTYVASALQALETSRLWNDPYQTTIVFLENIHFVGSEPMVLTVIDSGLTVTGLATERSWLSGCLPLTSSAHKVVWSRMESKETILMADLSTLFHSTETSTRSPRLRSLYGRNGRYVRARYPNGHPETDQWGYNSPTRYDHSIGADQVVEWMKPPVNGTLPHFDYVDLRWSDSDDTATSIPRPTKNDSTMDLYNVYAAGTGGVCADLWGSSSSSYWCSNASDGGWAEVDRECATTGQLQLPVGLVYNASSELGRRMMAWNQSAKGGIVHAWHSQSWAMHMFRIQEHLADVHPLSRFLFEPGGGKQGGRNWCRCDQCSYAAPWCGQRQDPPDHSDKRLISGTWMVENVLAELDTPGEYYLNEDTRILYIIPNVTLGQGNNENTGSHHLYQQLLQLELDSLSISVLEQLIRVQDGSRDITISRLGFRETSPTYMSDRIVPSGGDWSLHRGGALFIEHAENITVQDCTFSRLDGNAIFISGRTRDITIRRNHFEWLGESAICLLGDTDGFNATSRDFPMTTVIESNVMRELGIYEKQSSAVFVSKAARTLIRANIMFNLPRAAVNFNDMVGGGDVVVRNLIFNSCRESGDHGPINSWDRQPFLTDILEEGAPSFVPIRRIIAINLIFANYGASQGVDNDDGSSWYHVHHNVFYNANGFKMDYGGHDSIYEDNLVVGYPNKGLCVGFGSFYAGREHVVRRNICIAANIKQGIIQLDECRGSTAVLHDNRYYTPKGVATVQCGWEDDPIPFLTFQESYGLEQNSTLQSTPGEVKEVMTWALEVLFPMPLNDTVLLDATSVS